MHKLIGFYVQIHRMVVLIMNTSNGYVAKYKDNKLVFYIYTHQVDLICTYILIHKKGIKPTKLEILP